jgi:cytochrome b561
MPRTPILAQRARQELRLSRLAQNAGRSVTRLAFPGRGSAQGAEAGANTSAHSGPARAEPKKHHPLTIALHWGTVLCIVVAVTTVLLCEIVGDKFWRQVLQETHRQLGLAVLLVVGLRIGVRMRHRMADHMVGAPRHVRLAAMGCHWGLYGLLIGLPLLGWAATNAHNLQVRFLGLIPLPAMSVVDSELADQLSDMHLLGSWILLGLVSLHVAAALYHHFVGRDRVLWAMLPGRSDAFLPPTAAPARAPKPAHGEVELAG